jgi:hypothetical protein
MIIPVCTRRFRMVMLLGALAFQPALAQPEIPLGQWRMHLSYNSIKCLTSSNDKIFAAAESGILVFDKADNSLSTYTKLNGLSDTGISFILFDQITGTLVVTYANGNIDLVKDNVVTNFDRLKNSILVSGSKRINHISVRNGFAYLSTDFGLVVFDLGNQELKETWRDIGVDGANPMVRSSMFMGDSIFLATNSGIQAGNIHTNLLDFNNWKRFEGGVFDDAIGLSAFNSKVYAAISGVGIFHYENGKWIQEPYLPGLNYQFINASDNELIIGESENVWVINPSNTPVKLVNDKVTKPQYAIEDGPIWIGDLKNGLIANSSGASNQYIVNGPTTNDHFRLKYHDGALYSVSGGFTTTGVPLGNSGTLNVFKDGTWSNELTPITDVTDVEFFNSARYVSSFGNGLQQRDASGTTILFNESNSPLNKATLPDGVFVTALASQGEELFVANYRSNEPIHSLSGDGSWQSYSLDYAVAQFTTELELDFSNNLWLAISPLVSGGLIVFDPETNDQRHLTDAPGAGDLPNRNVRSLAVDRDGYVWVGTDEGVAYFFDKDEDAAKPIFENRFLLRDEKITAIEVDGGNRKWIGTERGVWLFNPTGEELIHSFTAENSPLLSNRIRDIEINDLTGEVFFATDKGIVSYRSDATASTNAFQSVKIVPNPVTGDFSGSISISGLATDAFVKITDISGKLIWETNANGGTATWNVRDYNGSRAATGVYLVFAASADGRESVVGKIVVVN